MLKDVFLSGSQCRGAYGASLPWWHGVPDPLNGIGIRLHCLIYNCQAYQGAASPMSKMDHPVPMQLGQTKLSFTEHEKQRRVTLCYCCGYLNYFVAQCPARSKSSTSSNRTYIHNPHISWHNRESNNWSSSCFSNCFHLPHLVIASTELESSSKHADHSKSP